MRLQTVLGLLAGTTAATTTMMICNEDNCLRAVQASSFPTRHGSADCVSYLQTTITPATMTFTRTNTAYFSQTSTVDATTTAVVEVTSTSVVEVTSTSIVDITSTSMLEATTTTTVDETETDTLDATTTIYDLKTATTTTVATETIFFRRMVQNGIEARSTAALLASSTIPAYASACSGSVRYSSACSCVGAAINTVTAATPSTTVTITMSISTVVHTVTTVDGTATVTTTDATAVITTTDFTVVITTTDATAIATTTDATVTTTITDATNTITSTDATFTTTITDTTDTITSTYTLSSSTSTSSSTSSSPSAAPTTNSIVNGGFEATDPTAVGWVNSGSTGGFSPVLNFMAPSNSDTAAHRGSQMASILVKANQYAASFEQSFSTIPGTTYTFSIWTWAPSNGAGCSWTFYQLATGLAYQAKAGPSLTVAANRGVWVQTTGTFTSQTATSMKFHIQQACQSGVNPRTFYVDDVLVTMA